MKHFDQADFDVPPTEALSLTPEDYLRLLHPAGTIGKTTLMLKDGSGGIRSKTYALEAAPLWVNNFLDNDSYVALNRFHGPRGVARLAALNGLFLDLDIDRLPTGASRAAGPWSLDLLMRLVTLRLPQPSVILSTGRGLAAIWLIDPLPPQALPRWQSAQNLLIDLFQCLGADPACRDAARVTRLPGSLNSKSQTFASIIGGTLERYNFDQLADEIYIASDRPTREQLRAQKERRALLKVRKQSGGLAVAARFKAVFRDLERLRLSWGGLVPEGSRNTWLHLYATCLSHASDAAEVPALVDAMATEATPGLPRSEVAGIAKIAARHASLPWRATPTTDGRYHYSGATIADLLGVTAVGAQALGLEQVMPNSERARRKAQRERLRRRAAGAASRDAWLKENSREREQPWSVLGISRSTYYRRLKAGQIVEPARSAVSETGPCSLQGGSALPKAPPEGRSRSGNAPTLPTSPRSRTQPARATQIEKMPAPAGSRLNEIVVETHAYVQPAHQQGEIDFARRRVYFPLERFRRE